MKRLSIRIDTDRLDRAEVRRLIRFGVSEIDTSETFVWARADGRWGGYGGSLSHHRFSDEYKRAAPKGSEYGIYIRLLDPSGREQTWGRPFTYHGGRRDYTKRDINGRRQRVPVRSGTVENPGRWPVHRLYSWQEYVVYIAAHESKHVEFARENLPQSEVRAEHHAAWMLRRYRAISGGG